MPFQPGVSGNPAGKLKGTRNKATIAVEAMLDGEAEDLTRKAIGIAPARKDRLVQVDVPAGRVPPAPDTPHR
jgi:hypothetical protein